MKTIWIALKKVSLLPMIMAAALMKERYITISQIALEVGFSNPSYFSKMFKQMFSVSPTEYIRLQSIKKTGRTTPRLRTVETKSAEDSTLKMEESDASW